MKTLIKIFILAWLMFLECPAQQVMTVKTDKSNYSYGDSMHVAVTITNNADTTFTIWGSSSCVVLMGFDSVQFQVQCTTILTDFPFAPHSSRTWNWELKPGELGIPESNGTHIIYGYGGGFRDTIKITAPKYYGGQVDVGFNIGTDAQDVQKLRDSLNAVVISSDTLKSLKVIDERWQITGFSVDSLDTAYSHDPRLNFIEVERTLLPVNEIYTGVKQTTIAPDKFSLSQNYPNPFNPSTTIKYSVASSSYVTIKVFDLLGDQVAALVNERKSPGKYSVNFDASNLSSGVYLYRIHARNYVSTKKMLLLK
jgi:Secretion system C-terminal sorting domain